MSALPKAGFLDLTTPPTMATLVILASMGALSMNIFVLHARDPSLFRGLPIRCAVPAVGLFVHERHFTADHRPAV